MMKLLEELISSLPDDAPVDAVYVGLHFTAVKSRCVGLAYTYKMPYGFDVSYCGELIGKSARWLAGFSKSWNLTEASIGVAAINSLIEPKNYKKINALDYAAQLAKNKKVAVIGHFPSLQKIKENSATLWVLERNPSAGELPDSACEYLLPEADVVLISGSAIINKTLGRLLELSRDAFTVVLGPSTPLSPIIFNYGADALGGIKVIDEVAVLKKVSQGARPTALTGLVEYCLMEREKTYG